MRPWGNNYSPTQMLDFCRVDAFRGPDNVNHYVQKILATMITQKDPQQLAEEITSIVRGIGRSVSIGNALETLHSIATCGPELDYGRDGLDALTYHLGGHQCENGIKALQAVLKRFEDDEKKPQEEPRERSFNPEQ